mmetsp:Transcript_12196/g.19152  ORF Transcript_12196/g.19152 Transcript_12196/m.19152 type:complete len:375 (-) Transcript_12196:195-1319(-)|eukprot:CAMPEP_0184294282 /NCGR_PEP_ID=MMETSP1049-20130417/5517_1 /TAXON_ID=77928 /ORGANISM="Proteomonas sulcata, Strain CCMP704" /LENGTH=374 /DNA_ID=CAMNT_0026602515 /DNA_START=70 /DNA_END=1194 /DNA_ORIENTATION=-
MEVSTRRSSCNEKLGRSRAAALVAVISIGSLLVLPQLASGQALDCGSFSDPEGARLRHSESRRGACDGMAFRQSCTYNVTLTEMQTVEGCCMQESHGSRQLYCASERSKEASAPAALYDKIADIVHTCQEGTLYPDPSVTASEAANYRYFGACGESVQPGPVCDPDAMLPIPADSTDMVLTKCHCMSGTQMRANEYCRCLEPNTEQTCERDEDCSGNGKCTARARVLDQFKPEGTSAAHLESYQRPDGVVLKRYKETKWFGDESVDTRPAAVYAWAYWEELTKSWIEYDTFNNEALEYAYLKDKKIAHVDLEGFSRNDVFVDFEGMRQLDSEGVSKEVRRQANAGSIHAPEKFKVQNIGDLDSGESLRRASVSP